MAAANSNLLRKVRVLHLEDSSIDADLVCEYLRLEGAECEIDRVWSREDFSAALANHCYDLILADHRLPAFDGESALEIAVEKAPETPFIFVSGTLGEEVAVEALKRGATDFVVKQRLGRLSEVVERALAEASERRERRRAEAALRESEANFATLVDALPQLCWMANPAGDTIWYNQRWYEYTGTTPEEMAALGRERVHHPDHLPEVLRQWRCSLAAGEPFEMTIPLLGADGDYRPFLTRAVPVRGEGAAIVRWLGTCTDVSAQVAAEAELKRLNDSLESRVVEAISEREAAFSHLAEMQKMETMGQLTGGVAHDFNNLLTPIVGGLDVLRRRLDGDTRSERLLSGALEAAERAKILVQRLLAFARRQVLESRPVDVVRLVGGLRDMIGRSIGPQIRVEVEADDDLPAARVDPNQLELALLNLAVNARDAMPDGGILTVSITAEAVGPGHPNGLRYGTYVRIGVRDTGSGMDEVTLKRAIEPFYSTKGIGKGTGLGLSMVHGLAAQSGGALLLDSVLGEGTNAELWLPAAATAADAEQEEDNAAIADTPAATILLVDDEDLVRSGTAEMLADLGHRVIEARSAGEALELLRSGVTADLVITDYLMPGMNGAELATAIRNRLPGVPILLATGYANLAGHQMADLPLLTKPFRQKEVAARLAELLPRRAREDC
ncbi:response regulator [Sphingosinicella sp. BN140058]|uniref:response regulator n=1 Tax=Sphingosinicella sp. BN140058 TaxID=1892855 RepID=UPI001010E6E8|nr:response regulator [Sphingosinicella sp. BN140058]QAY75496.1 response regulator [Sphingosinicella sp. BN140058]